MPQVQYPFIDVAVHPAVRGRFAAGETIVIFSRDMRDVLWANGDGARLFGHDAIYDLIESGPDRASVSYRQLGAAAAQLMQPGDRRGFMMRIASGFRTAAAPAEVSLIEIGGQAVVMFATASGGTRRLSALLEGFDDPDTHMALLDGSGATQAASAGFSTIGILPETLRGLISAANRVSDGLIKRPVATGAGYVPAAIGRLSDDLYLLFCVETSLGRMDAPEQEEEVSIAAPAAVESAEAVAEVAADAGTAEDAVNADEAPAALDLDVVTGEYSASESLSEQSAALESVSGDDIAELAALDGADEAMIAAAAAEGGESEIDPDLAAAPEVMDDNLAVLGEPIEGEPVEAAEGTVAELAGADDHVASQEEADFVAGQSAEDEGLTLAKQSGDLVDGAVEVLAAAAAEGGESEIDPDLAVAPEVMADNLAVLGEPIEGEPVEPAEGAIAELAGADDHVASQEEADFVAGQSTEDEGLTLAEESDDLVDGAVAESEGVVEEPIADIGRVDVDGVSDDAVDAEQIAGAEPGELAAPVADLDTDEPAADKTDLGEALPEDGVAEALGIQDAAAAGNSDSDISVDPDSIARTETTAEIQFADETVGHEATETNQEDSSVDDRWNETASEDAPTHTETSLTDQLGADAETAAEELAEEVPSGDLTPYEADAATEDMSGNAADKDLIVDTVPADAAESDEAGNAVPVQPEAQETSDFAFNRGGRPVRFVWKLDAEGRFDDVSEEFGRAVGPRSGSINGRLFKDLAARFDLDPGKEISGLLERRDTWSGRTIRWPVEGTDLVVPVDLAALPTYSRDREFEGFRGFGIVRIADAEVDPRAMGMQINAENAPLTHEDVPLTVDGQFGELHDGQRDETAVEVAEPAEPAAESTQFAEEPVAPETVPEPLPAAPDAVPQDEFRGEVPALNIVSNPLASFNNKIIQLEERRARAGRDGLSAAEQAALREIARQLEPFGKRPNEELLKSSSGLLQDDEEIGTAEEVLAQPETVDVAPETDVEQGFELGAEAATAEDAPARSEVTQPTGENAEDTGADEAAGEADEDASRFEALSEETAGEWAGLTADAVDQVPLAILIHAGDRLIHANSEFKRLTGYDSVEMLDRAGGLDALITRREGPDAGVYLIRQDGSDTMVSARLQSVRFEGSSALMLALTPLASAALAPKAEAASDNDTARQVAALTVEVSELRAILETATDGVIILDTEGRIRSLNRSAAGLFNFDDAETRGKPFAMLFAHESQKSVQDYLAGLAGHGVASVLNDGREVIGRESSGGFIPLFMTMGRLPGSNSYCAVIRDITQWKRSEEELRAAKRAAETANQHKSDFLARVSHEIRTPLNAIIGFSDMIASEHLGPAGHTRYVEYASDIGRSGRHVLDIVNDLLDISKIEAGEMDLEFAAVGINDCVSEAVSLVQPQANAQRVIIRTSLSQSVPDVVADLRSIKQIAINILANAIRFTPSGGQIVVSTVYEPTGSVMLRIRDTGVGMSKSELELAMKPFGQVSAGTRQRGEGTGLGLPLTKAMTEANRATFSIHSAPNEGTLVEIVFPPQRVLAD